MINLAEIQNIPDCLKRPIKFGDREQIDALERIGSEIEDKEDYDRRIESGELKQFDIRARFEGEYNFTIYAENKEAAKKLSEKKSSEIAIFDLDNVELTDIDVYEV